MNLSIPYQTLIRIHQIDPRLDPNWRSALHAVISTLDPALREAIIEQVLKPRQIVWVADSGRWAYLRPADAGLRHLYENAKHDGIRNLIRSLVKVLRYVRDADDVLAIAASVENVLEQLAKQDTEENAALRRLKNEVRVEFIYELAAVIHGLKELKMPPSQRHLTPEIIKDFILNVYLKQQLLSYAFHTLRRKELLDSQYPFVRNYLVREQKLRQLEIIQTPRHLFVLAPSHDKDVNVYSIRRFLSEQKLNLKGDESIFLTGAAASIQVLTDESLQARLKSEIECIIGLQSFSGKEIMDAVERFEHVCSDKLVPLLFAPFDSSGAQVEKLVQARLRDFEQWLAIDILEPVRDCIRKVVQGQDEMDFIHVSLKQILGELNTSVATFKTLPVGMFNQQVDIFLAKLTAYAMLLEKRSAAIFSLMSDAEWDEQAGRVKDMSDLLKESIHEYAQEYRELKTLYSDAERDLKRSRKSVLAKFTGKPDRIASELEELNQELTKVRWNAYREIPRLARAHADATVSMEFETTVSLDPENRHYAFAAGENGLTRLPVMFRVPSDRSLFSIEEVKAAIDTDLRFVNQKWSRGDVRQIIDSAPAV